MAIAAAPPLKLEILLTDDLESKTAAPLNDGEYGLADLIRVLGGILGLFHGPEDLLDFEGVEQQHDSSLSQNACLLCKIGGELRHGAVSRNRLSPRRVF